MILPLVFWFVFSFLLILLDIYTYSPSPPVPPVFPFKIGIASSVPTYLNLAQTNPFFLLRSHFVPSMSRLRLPSSHLVPFRRLTYTSTAHPHTTALTCLTSVLRLGRARYVYPFITFGFILRTYKPPVSLSLSFTYVPHDLRSPEYS